MRRLIIILLVLLLTGCVQSIVSQRHIEIVGGKQITYVTLRTGNTILDHSVVCDRFGPDGTLLAHDVFSNNGILETLGGQALQTLVPAFNAYEAIYK